MLEWAAISTAVAPLIKKYVTEKAAKLATDYADSTAARLYKRLIPDQKLQKAVESFVAAFDKELRSTIENPTLTGAAYADALKVFLADFDVLEALEKPLDAQSELDWDLLKRRWTYLVDSKDQHLIDLPQEFDWDDLATRYGKSLQKQVLADPELHRIAQTLAILRMKKDTKREADAVERLAPLAKRFDLAGYAQSVKEAYSFLRIGSLDPDWTVYKNRIPLEHVYIPQSAKSAIPPRDLTRDYLKERKGNSNLKKNEGEKEQYDQLLPVPVLQIIDDPVYKHSVILGDPGLGKSTLLKYLALRWANQQTLPLALLLELRRTVREFGEIDFLDYLERGTGQTRPLPRMDLDWYLRENDSLVLFDALDEVAAGHRGDVVLRIIAFARQYPKARIIVTTRIHGYHPGSIHPEQFRDADFRQFTLQDFQPQEVTRFITMWHKEAFEQPSDRTKYESRLCKALADSPAIRELSANPLLLTMMAVLNRVQDLPRDRARLYERCAELLLKNWDLEKFEELKERKETQDVKDKLGPDQKMRILELVAVAMQAERTGLAGNIICEDQLKQIIEKQLAELSVPQPWAVAGDLIWMLRERNFMLAYLGDRQYAFVHRTFFEYFCARDLKYRLEKTSALSVDQLANFYSAKWLHDEWQEALCLLSGMIGGEHAAKCISALLSHKYAPGGEKAVFLAANCLFEIRELGKIQEIRMGVQRALFLLAELYSQEEQEGARIHIAALRQLARGWKEETGVVGLLRQAVLYGRSSFVRIEAMRELARGWKEESGILAWLQKIALREEDPYIRWTVVEELAHIWQNEVEMMVWLKECAIHDESAIVRWKTVRELARAWKEENGMTEWLKERALNDKSEYVRTTVIQELAHGWPDDPEVAAFVQRQQRLSAPRSP